MLQANEFLWKFLKVICWIIFLGLCIQTGTLLFNFIFSLFRPVATHNLYAGLDLSKIYNQSLVLYSCLFSLAIAVSALKAYLFYVVIKLFMQLNLKKPFNEQVSFGITKIGYCALFIGLLGYLAERFNKGLLHKGYETSVINSYWNDSETFLLLSAVIVVIAMIFKKGIELQNENDLTV